ncbi:MAG TPA: hypothetical protein VIK53_05630 [Verrucomicrobiae bacterium]
MSEFKFACPVCGQHMMCDSSQGGSVMDCPTCFQKITAPQAPASDDQKFILTGTQVTEKRIATRGLATAPGKRDSDKSVWKVAVVVAVLALVGAAAFALRGKLFTFGSAWQADDIGEVGATGSFSHAGGVFTVNGSGADTWRRADGFFFIHQPLDGDGALAAHMLNLKNTDLWAKAGVMIRETTAAGSMFAEIAIRPDGQAQFIWRNATGGEAAGSQLAGGIGHPKWIKIVRSGNRFSAFYRVNAIDDWLPIGGTQTINMSSETKAGLVVCAHKAGTLCEAQFDQVTLQPAKNDGQQ